MCGSSFLGERQPTLSIGHPDLKNADLHCRWGFSDLKNADLHCRWGISDLKNPNLHCRWGISDLKNPNLHCRWGISDLKNADLHCQWGISDLKNADLHCQWAFSWGKCGFEQRRRPFRTFKRVPFGISAIPKKKYFCARATNPATYRTHPPC